MRSRLLVSVIGVPVILVVILWAPVMVLVVALALLSAIAAFELMRCVGVVDSPRKSCVLSNAAILGALCAVFVQYRYDEYYAALIVIYTLLIFAYAVYRAGEIKFQQIMAALFAMYAIPYAFSSFLRLHEMGVHRAYLLLPLLFLPGNDDSAPDSTGADISERAALYYRYTTDDSLQLRRLDESEVDNDAYIECVRTIETITNQLIMDEGELRSDGASGVNFYTLSDNGESLRIMEYYHEWTGDWHNWFTIHIDIDTMDIYYIYYSANVQSNGESYSGLAQEHLQEAGSVLLPELGFSTPASMDEGDDGVWSLQLGRPSGEELGYDVICNIYEDAAPSLLIDLRITLRTATSNQG